MKHKVTVMVEVEKKGLFGIKRKVPEKRIIEVDEKTYRKLKKKKPEVFSFEELMLFEFLAGDE